MKWTNNYEQKEHFLESTIVGMESCYYIVKKRAQVDIRDLHKKTRRDVFCSVFKYKSDGATKKFEFDL